MEVSANGNDQEEVIPGESKVKLKRLSELFKFKVTYTDFHKKEKKSTEFLSLLTLSTDTSQVNPIFLFYFLYTLNYIVNDMIQKKIFFFD